MLNKMRLKPYLLMVFSALIVLAGIIALVGIIGLQSTQNNTENLIHQVLDAYSAVKDCRIATNVAARDLREMVLSEDPQQISQFESNINDNIQTIEEQVQVFKDAHGTEDGLAQRYETAFQNWFNIANEVIDEAKRGNWEMAKETILNECSPAMNELADIAQEIDAVTTQERSLEEESTLVMLRVYMIILVVVFVLALVFGLVVALKTTSMITKAVSKIRAAAEALSKGDLKAQVDYDGKNEFGDLAERLNFSFGEISKYIDAIDYGMTEFSSGNFSCECPIQFRGDFAHIQASIENFQEKMRSTLTELEASSAQVSAGAEQVADGAQALAQGATQQASSVEELSASISEISNLISDTAEFSQKADQLGQESREIVNKGKEEMKQLLSSIQDIADASNNIQSIIKVIDDIAFQTNVLALNAAVEAARAGNAGKGFAVVADEVRSLAQKSADAAQETTGLIKNSLQHVSHGEEIAKRTDTAFNDVAEASQNILDMIAKIARASQEQADAISQISVGIDQISAVVQTNSATSEESAAASEELSSQANVMKELLGGFTLTADNGQACYSSVSEGESGNAYAAPAGVGDKY